MIKLDPAQDRRAGGGGSASAEGLAAVAKDHGAASSLHELAGLDDSAGQGRGVGSGHGLDDCALVEDLEGRQAADAVHLRDAALFGVDLDKGHLLGLGVLVSQALKVRPNHLARAAPVGVDYS